MPARGIEKGRLNAIKSLRALKGLPVLMDGKALGRAVDAELDEALTRMVRLRVDCGLLGSRVIQPEQIRLLGDVSVLVTGKGRRARVVNSPLRRVLLTDGTRVGAVSGAAIDERTHRVEALELTRGYWDDLVAGRQWIFHYTVNQMSGDVLLRPEGGDSE